VDISNRDIRNRKIARELLTNPTQSYSQIAEKIGIENINIQRQSIYQYLHTNSFKAVMEQEIPKFYDENKLKRKLDEAIEQTKPKDSVHGKYLELGMKSLGMLTERVENINKPHDNLDTINTDDLQAELVRRLRLSQEGVFGNDSLRENIENKGVNAHVSPPGDNASE
jgi:hypothetical protein